MLRQFPDGRQRIGIRLGPEGAQLAEEDVHGHRSDAVECEQPLLKIIRITCLVVQATQAAAVVGDQLLGVAQDLRDFRPS